MTTDTWIIIAIGIIQLVFMVVLTAWQVSTMWALTNPEKKPPQRRVKEMKNWVTYHLKVYGLFFAIMLFTLLFTAYRVSELSLEPLTHSTVVKLAIQISLAVCTTMFFIIFVAIGKAVEHAYRHWTKTHDSNREPATQE